MFHPLLHAFDTRFFFIIQYSLRTLLILYHVVDEWEGQDHRLCSAAGYSMVRSFFHERHDGTVRWKKHTYSWLSGRTCIFSFRSTDQYLDTRVVQ